MAGTTEKKSGAAKVSGGKASGGRRFTPRQALAETDAKRVSKVTTAFKDEKPEIIVWAERYATKVLKHKAGLRATPAPVPPQLGDANAKKVREVLGIPEEAPKPKPAAKAKPAAKKADAKPAEAEADASPAEALAGEPA